MWIKFANLCRKSDRMALAGKTINTLLAPHVSENVSGQSSSRIYLTLRQAASLHFQRMKAPPNVVYAHLKFMWESGAKDSSLTFLRQFSNNLARDLQQDDIHAHPWVARERKSHLSKLLARCYFKQGQWQMKSSEGWVTVRLLPTCLGYSTNMTTRRNLMRSSIATLWQLVMTQTGTKRGIPGLWQIWML